MLTLCGTDDKINFVAERHKQLKKIKTLKKLLTSQNRCDNLSELSQESKNKRTLIIKQ